MNRKIVLSTLLLAIIAVALVVSCSGNIDVPTEKTEELSYVIFGNGHSRELSTSYETEPYNLLYWFYTAEKKDSYGKTGEVGLGADNKPTEAVSKNGNNPAQGLSGRVGPFSQGKWEFTLYAYGYTKTGEGESATYSLNKNKLVYKSSPVQVDLKGGDVKNVPVSVSLQGETGYVKLDNVSFSWLGQGGTGQPVGKLVFTGSDPSHSFEVEAPFVNFCLNGYITYSDTTYNIPADFYTVTATAYLSGNEGTPLVKQVFGLRVYGNATTVIYGNVQETVDTFVEFDVAAEQMTVFQPVSNSESAITSQITSVEEGTTIVTFPQNVLETGVTHQLDVKVTAIAGAEEKFQVSALDGSTQAAVAGIDLTLSKVTTNLEGTFVITNLTEFSDDIIVETFIAKNLSNVAVLYNDNGVLTHHTDVETKEEPADSDVNYYIPSSGKLVFTTNHFSEYCVIADYKFLNSETGAVFVTFDEAVKALGEGQTLKAVSDYAFDYSPNRVYRLAKDSVLDLGGCTFDVPYMSAILEGENITIQNGKFTGDASYPLFVGDEGENNSATVRDITVQGGINAYNTSLLLTGDNRVIVPENNQYYYAVWADENARITIDSGIYETNNDKPAVCSYTESPTEITILGGNYSSSAYGKEIQDLSLVSVISGTFLHEPDSAFVHPASIAIQDAVSGLWTVSPRTEGGARIGTQYYETLTAALSNAAVNDIVVVEENAEIDETVTLTKSMTLDLNSKTVSFEKGNELKVGNDGEEISVLIKNGKLSGTGFTSITYSFISIMDKSELVLENTEIVTDGTALYPMKNTSDVRLSLARCTVTASGYAIATNASSPESTNVIISVSESNLTGSTGIVFNVKGKMTITDSVVTATTYQAVFLRGGDSASNHLIQNTTLQSLQWKYSDNYYMTGDGRNSNWGSGNAAPVAPLVIGNRSTSSYLYPISVRLDNVELKYTGPDPDAPEGSAMTEVNLFIWENREIDPVKVSYSNLNGVKVNSNMNNAEFVALDETSEIETIDLSQITE